MQNLLKKIISFIYPITVFKTKTKLHNHIEIVLHQGEYLLETKNVNYSYGSLQKVLKLGLNQIGIFEIKKMQNILVLGVAGGSVIKTLVDDFNYTKQITGIEIDEGLLDLANNYFGLNKIKNFKGVVADAENYVETTPEIYNLIIVDVFNDNEMPEFLFERKFIFNLVQKLPLNGYILFNLMLSSETKNKIINDYLIFFDNKNYSINHLRNVAHYNDLLIIKKLF